MTPEERDLLNRIASSVQDNSVMLHGIRRSMRWGTILRSVYWIIIIGSGVGAFWLVQPYLNTLTGGASSDFSRIQEMISAYKAQSQQTQGQTPQR